MKTRRSFIKTISTGTVLTTLGISSVNEAVSSILPGTSVEGKPIRIGIIGAENSHTIKFGQLFNIDKKFPGVEVKYVWGETDEFAKNAALKGQIPNNSKRSA